MKNTEKLLNWNGTQDKKIILFLDGNNQSTWFLFSGFEIYSMTAFLTSLGMITGTGRPL